MAHSAMSASAKKHVRLKYTPADRIASPPLALANPPATSQTPCRGEGRGEGPSPNAAVMDIPSPKLSPQGLGSETHPQRGEEPALWPARLLSDTLPPR